MIVVAIDGRVEGLIGIADEVKKSAPRAIAALQDLGLRVIMMTGDNPTGTARVAEAVGVREYRAFALASRIAWSSEPDPEPAVAVTVNVSACATRWP